MFYVLAEPFRKQVCAGLDAKFVVGVLRKYGLLEQDTVGTRRIPGLSGGPKRAYWISSRIVGFDPEAQATGTQST
ncbi:hypothetical protein [Burkholderia sp. BCC1640]|uniref:hypothetical protein n=1 Tax=Burkholderia sp. BCC1640 TaxID=2676294 RepID=UPI00158B29E1|nr:hypothetical protein [Burkholderia sp. BCC1640]